VAWYGATPALAAILTLTLTAARFAPTRRIAVVRIESWLIVTAYLTLVLLLLR